MTMSDLSEVCADRGDELRTVPDRESAFVEQAVRAVDRDRVGFVVSDGRAWALLETARTSTVDAAVLHEVLLPAWGVADEQVGYHHSLDQALHTTARQPGIVVAVHPPSLSDVMASAARGIRMPRKSTSFAPKPRMGVVMRDLRDA
jgi:3-oxoacyl-(acyl-carrier-protein) synthase